MIVTLLVSSLVIAVVVSTVVVFVFKRPIDVILKRVVPAEISYAWARYLRFAIYVVGIGAGVQIWSLEKYITPQEPYKEVVQLTSDRWVLEIFNTVMGSLQGIAMILLVFFVFALVAVVVVRVFETRAGKTEIK